MMFTSIQGLLAGIPAILIAITFHEYAHGKMASILGDPTPKQQGRLSLNPIKHLDILGSLMLVVAGFGWAKPVEVNPYYFSGDRRRGMMLVGLAGPLMNIVLAYLAAVILSRVDYGFFAIFLSYLLWFNAMLAVFNLIPFPPLDGSKVLAGILPRQMASSLYSLEAYGPLILLVLLATGVLGRVLRPAVEGLMQIIVTVANWGYF
ncbi:MAG: site-2 protease family protein [Syntrophomonadaceae bacterium]|jgi:Zn-dependent protease|nr:site-2 protease family protein [Syntrophomonadaceae bacterium]